MSGAGRAGRVLSTLNYHRRAAWTERVDILVADGLGPGQLLRQLGRAARRYDLLVLDGSTGMRREPLSAAIIRRGPRAPALILLDATWKRGESRTSRALRRAALRVLDGPRVHYAVLSRDEQRSFAANWGVDPRRVHYVPWYVALENEGPAPTPRPATVFAGGDSLRDYGALVRAVDGLDVELTIAARRLPGADPAALPPNVRAGPVSHERFVELMAAAAVVVVPLEARRDRSAGQQTYLRSMAMAKPTIVSDAFGARDYVEDGVTGLVVSPGDARALRAAIAWCVDPANAPEVRRMGERARAAAHAHFSPEAHVQALLGVVDRVLAGERSPAQQEPLDTQGATTRR